MTLKYTICDGVVERSIRDNVVLVPMKTGPGRLDALYTLNETSAFIWNELRVPLSEEELTARLSSKYEIDEATARGDVRGIVKRLLNIEAIRVVDQAG